HHRHGDLADDRRLPGDAEADFLLAHPGRAPDLLQRVGHHVAVHHLAIDDRLRGQRRVSEVDQRVRLACLAELADLDAARADVHANQILAFAHGFFRFRVWLVYSRGLAHTGAAAPTTGKPSSQT